MNHIDVGRYWDENAEAWTVLSRHGSDRWRNHVNAPAFIQMLGDVSGLHGLDVGCGEGYNTRLVADKGAHLTAFDISAKFLRYAVDEALATGKPIRHLRASGLEMPFPSERFDFVMATMSLMDMPNHDVALAEIHRVLKPGGFLQFSICHPCFLTQDSRWVEDESGKRIGWMISNYFQPIYNEIEEWTFTGAPATLQGIYPKFRVPRFERTLESWLNLVITSGFVLECFDEPHPEGDALKEFPHHAFPPTVPFSLLIRCRKT